jgi:hypothetical protein
MSQEQERKEIVSNLLEQVEKLKKIKEFKTKIQAISDILLDLHYYYQKYRQNFYMYIYGSAGEKPTVCVVTKYAFIEIKCYNENDVQKVIEMFFNDLNAETRIWKALKDAFSDFVALVEDIISEHEEKHDP